MFEFFNTIYEWILSIPDQVSDAIDYASDFFEIWFYDFIIQSINKSVSFIQTFMTSESYLSTFESSYGALSQDTRFAVEYLNIPEAIILILSAYTVRFALKFI